jgi:hypothetical protein
MVRLVVMNQKNPTIPAAAGMLNPHGFSPFVLLPRRHHSTKAIVEVVVVVMADTEGGQSCFANEMDLVVIPGKTPRKYYRRGRRHVPTNVALLLEQCAIGLRKLLVMLPLRL